MRLYNTVKTLIQKTSFTKKVRTFCFLKYFFYIEVLLMCNVVLISAVQQGDSTAHIYILFEKISVSIMVYHRTLNTILRAI